MSQAPDFGPFDGAVSAMATGTAELPTGGTETLSAESFATQTSTLDQTGIHAAGFYAPPSFARTVPTFFFAGRAGADLRVAFELTVPHTFSLDVSPGGSTGTDENRFRFTGPGDQVIAQNTGDDFPAGLDGELAVGQYILDLHIASIADMNGASPASYRLNLDLAAVGGPPGPTPVPLPPAVWPGLAMLGGVGGICWLRRRAQVAH